MAERLCAECEVSLDGLRSTAKYCSQLCRNEATLRRRASAGEPCSVGGCTKPLIVKSRRLCGQHYQAWKKHGDPEPTGVQERDRTEGPCGVTECPRPKKCGGFCGLHYQRFLKHGDPRHAEYLDVTCETVRHCRYCGVDISHKQANASWCSRDCKYWARIWRHRKGVADNPESIKVPPETIKKILSSGQCSYCGEYGPVELDHIIPISRGGAHREGNLTPACRPCNRSKWDMFLYEWRYRHARRGVAST